MIPYLITLFCPLWLWLPGAVPALDWVEISLCQMIHLGVLSRPLGGFGSHLCSAFASCGVSDVPVLLGDQTK